MQLIIYASALAGLLSTAMAAPVTESTKPYQWSVSLWQFSRGQSEYDYSFSIKGPADPTSKQPGFSAKCQGAAQKGFKACSVTPVDGGSNVPDVFAKVKIVQDPNDPNDNVPEVFVKETWSDSEGCQYQESGHYIKTGFNQPVGSKKGSKFNIVSSSASAVC